MAEKQPTKRRVKNPETFRERALKANETTDKPGRSSGVKKAGGAVARPVSAPFKRIGATKPGRVAKAIFLPAYIRNSWQELKKVAWPSWRESRRLTSAVLVFAIVFGALVAAVDWGLDRIFRGIILK